MGLTLTIRRGVATDVRVAVRSFTRFVRREIEIPHRLLVTVTEHYAVPWDEKTVTWAKFDATGRYPKIMFGGALPGLISSYNGDRPAAIEETIGAFAHELVHYEQFRDGRELSERGVAVRARNLVKQYHLWQGE